MSQPTDLVISTTPQPGTRVCTLNRPAKRNALSQDLIDQLLRQLQLASADPEVRSIIITGAGGFFSAGADIKEISQLDAEDARRVRYLQDLCDGVRNVRKPIIVAVEGKALGGGFELALMTYIIHSQASCLYVTQADFIVATPESQFGLPEVSIGLIPGAGGTQRLTSALGKYRTMNVILLGELLSGSEAHNVGLVSHLAEPGKAGERALDLAAKLASRSPTAIQLAKEAISTADQLGQDEPFERSLYYMSFGTKDKKEGVSAFLEKRPPVWSSSA